MTAAWKEPYPGWVEGMNGPTGLIIGGARGKWIYMSIFIRLCIRFINEYENINILLYPLQAWYGQCIVIQIFQLIFYQSMCVWTPLLQLHGNGDWNMRIKISNFGILWVCIEMYRFIHSDSLEYICYVWNNSETLELSFVSIFMNQCFIYFHLDVGTWQTTHLGSSGC